MTSPRADEGAARLERIVEHVLDAPIVAVTVLEDRAVVTRRGRAPSARGQLRLVLPEVTPLLVDKSLRVTCEGAEILDVRCVRTSAPWRAELADAARSEAATRRAEVARARRAHEAAMCAADVARGALEAHEELRRAELAALAEAAARGETAEGAAAALDAQDEIARAALRERVSADALVKERARAIMDLEQLALRAAQREGQDAARLELDCVAERDGQVTIEYMVPAAAWRPYHRAQLAERQLAWEPGACIWQSTQEDWSDVVLTLSAERPSLGVAPPEVRDDLLDVRSRSSHVEVAAREQEIEQVGARVSDGRSAPVVMGVDDGGLGLALRPVGRWSVRSDGRPHRVSLPRVDCDAETSLLAVPLRSPVCHVRARFVHHGDTPILSGPVDLLRSSGFVGRGEIDFLAAGESAELGFGSEPEIRVHREQHEEHEDPSLLSGSSVKTVRVILRLSNLGAQAREVTVCDRVPVSEIEQVSINIAPAGAYVLEDEGRPGEEHVPQITARTIDPNGIVTWIVPLAPRGRAAVTLQYRVKSQRGVSGL